MRLAPTRTALLAAAFLASTTAHALTPTPTPNAVLVTPGAAGVTASTHDGNVPANVVDNNLGTRWSAGGDGQWIQLALPGQAWLRSVSIGVYRGNERKNRFDILASADGTTWTALLTNVQSSGTTTAQETYALPYQLASRLRYRGHGHVTDAGVTSTMNSVTEIDVVATTNQPTAPPSAPSGVQAFPDQGRVTLRWTHSGGAYRVYRSADQCDTFAFVGTTSASFDQSVTFSDMNVIDGRRYYYAVSAFNNVGESARTAPIAATPQLQRPVPPVLSATSGPVDSGRIDLSWTISPANATRYTIRRALRPECYPVGFPAWSDLATVDAPAQSYSDTTAGLDKRYLYTVSGSNAAGTGPASNVAEAKALSSSTTPTPTVPPCPTASPTPAPPPVTGVPRPPNPISVEAISNRVRVNWTRTGPIGERPFTFSVYRADTACGPFQQIARYLTDTRYDDSAVTNGTTYYYVAAGVNPRGESLDSDVVGTTPGNVAPKAPTGLTATAQPGPSVRLSWTEVLADSYNVKRAGTSGGPYTTIASGIPAGTGTTRTWDDTTVAPGSLYYYVVTAMSALEGPRSNEASVATPGGMPAPRLNVHAGLQQINLVWTTIPGATSYRVRLASTSCGSFSDLTTVTGTSYTFTTSSPARRYFTVIALGPGAESAPSDVAAAAPLLSIAAPTVTAESRTAQRIELSWPHVAGATGYRILRARQQPQCYGGLPPFELLATTATTTPTTYYMDDAISPATTYHYRVHALAPGGESGAGTVSARSLGYLLGATPTPMSCPTPTPTSTPTPTPPPFVTPGAPQNVAVVATNQKATLSWSDGFGRNSYTIFRGTTSCGPYQIVARDVTRSPFVDGGLTNGMPYFYVLSARNQNGEGPQSEEVTATPALSPPDPVTGLVNLGADPYPRFQWTPSYGAYGYRIRRGGSSPDSATEVGHVAADSFVDVSAQPGVSNVYWIAALNVRGESAPVQAFGTARNAPPAPESLTAATTASGIALEWSASAGATQYKLYRGTDPNGWLAPLTTVSGTSWHDQSSLMANVRYYYVVRAISQAESLPSPLATAMGPGSIEVEITPPASRVTASTHDGNLPGNTVDGNLGTRWSGFGAGAWVRFDLGTTRTVTSVKVAVYRGDTRRNSFYIQTSPDNVNWTSRWAGSSSGTTTALESYDIIDTPARYIRYYGQGNVNSTGSAAEWNSVTEIEIFALP